MLTLGRKAESPNDLAWPESRLGEAVELLARRAGLTADAMMRPDMTEGDPAKVGATVEQQVAAVAARLGIEAEPAHSSLGDVPSMVCAAAPALLALPRDLPEGGLHFLALLKGGRRPCFLSPEHKLRRIPAEAARDALCQDIVAPWRALIALLVAEAGVPEVRRERATAAIVREQVSGVMVVAGWLLRQSPAAPFIRQARHARLAPPLIALFAATILIQLLAITSWWIVGRAALTGRLDSIWLAAWALLLFTTIPVQILSSSAQSRLAIGAATLLKQRLLYGALRLAPDAVRHLGMGQFIARITQSEALENLGTGGGMQSVVSAVQLISAAGVLAAGIGGWAHALLLLIWTAALLAVSVYYYRRSKMLVDYYNSVSNSLVERLVGHRTRLAQEDARLWHAEEDRELAYYLSLSQSCDRAGVGLASLSSSWFVAGLGAIAFALLAGEASLPKLAISIGGVLLASQALSSIVAGMSSLIAASLSWRQVAPLVVQSHESAEDEGSMAGLPARQPNGAEPLLVAKDLHFRYGERGHLALQGLGLQIMPGDRLLVEGPSGGGKSTLAAVLAGLRHAQSGLLLLGGFDRHSIGARLWRQHVAMAPQFHENHVFTGTLAFNLLLGRRWPASEEDLAEAQSVCRELGLGDLIDRMPSGMQQMVGESGWQLSHGERSRLFIARAVLQNAELVIFDESFGALDPENLLRSLRCAIDRSKTLMVIAHP